MSTSKHDPEYWVYIPYVNEAGVVVCATSFEDAFQQGCEILCPEEGAEVQVWEVGASQAFYV